MHYHVIARAVVWGGRLQVFGTGAVRDCCSHRPANDMLSPPVPGAYVPSWRVSAFAPDGPPSPPPPLLVDSVVQFARMSGCFTSWYRHAPGLCGRHAIFFSYLIATLVGIILLVSSQIPKLGGWYRSITIEIMILFHAPDPVPLSVPVYTPFFKLSL